MSDIEEIKRDGELEDTLGIAKTEISEVTIIEYRKNQIVRLAECLVGAGLVVVGVKYRKKLPAGLGVTLAVTGAGMFAYNGRNLYKNWKQDGKLIREAIKTKKVEEKKIRDELKKKPETQNQPPREEIKVNQSSPPQSKPDAKPQVNRDSNSHVPMNGNSNKMPATKDSSKLPEKKEIITDNNENIIIADKIKVEKPIVQLANIVEPTKSEGETIYTTVTENVPETVSPVIEATIVPTNNNNLSENGNGKTIG